MPHGKTLDMVKESRVNFYRNIKPRDKKYRNRALRGKTRRNVRKYMQRVAKANDIILEG